MPPLNQPKNLNLLCLSAWSLYIAKSLKSCSRDQHLFWVSYSANLPASVLESAGTWILQSAGSLLRCTATEDQYGLDDQEVVLDQVNYLKKCLEVILHPKLKNINLELTIDMRTFQNFTNSTLVDVSGESEFDELKSLLVVTDHEIEDFEEIKTVSQFLADFIDDLENNHEMKMFDASFCLIDRDCSRINDIEKKVSLTWMLPSVLINLVDHCQQLTHLNLEYFDQLTDLGLEYIAGATAGQGEGLLLLEEIVLPKESFVTKEGIKVLMEKLPAIILIENAGRLGELFDSRDLSFPQGRNKFEIVELDQTEGVTMDEMVEDFDSDELEIVPWIPSEATLQRITMSCPGLKRLKLWTSDEALEILSSGLSQLSFEELDATLISDTSIGVELFCRSFSTSLVSLKLSLSGSCNLDFIEAIATSCMNLGQLHLEFSTSICEGIDKNLHHENRKGLFPNLQDLKVKTLYCDSDLPRLFFHYLLAGDSDLCLVDFYTSMTWMSHPDIVKAFSKHANTLEMVILSDPYSSINLSMESVNYFVDNFPKLTAVGNLRNWKFIDYYDCNSVNFYKSESELSELKRRSKTNNWNINYDMETLPGV